MIGIDTNVLVRYLTRDDATQFKLASNFLEIECSSGSPGFTNHIVLCELVWVLEGAYSYPRDQIAAAIDMLLRVSQLRVESPPAVWHALQAYRGGHDFADALIGRHNQNQRCSETVTFDRKASRLETFRLLG